MQEFLIEAMADRAFQLTLTENRDTISYGDVGEWLFEFSTLIAKKPDIYVCVEFLLGSLLLMPAVCSCQPLLCLNGGPLSF